MLFSENLRALRKKNGWTQGQLAEKSGMPKAQIARYETTAMIPSEKNLEALAKAFKVGVNELRFAGPKPMSQGELDELMEKISLLNVRQQRLINSMVTELTPSTSDTATNAGKKKPAK